MITCLQLLLPVGFLYSMSTEPWLLLSNPQQKTLHSSTYQFFPLKNSQLGLGIACIYGGDSNTVLKANAVTAKVR